jgi:hypothetical protein
VSTSTTVLSISSTTVTPPISTQTVTTQAVTLTSTVSTSTTSVAVETNLLANPGFETGDDDPWRISVQGVYSNYGVSMDSPHTGNYSYHATLSNGGGPNGDTFGSLALTQDPIARLDASHTYELGFWGRSSDTVPGGCVVTGRLSTLIASSFDTNVVISNKRLTSDYTYFSGQGTFFSPNSGEPFVDIIVTCQSPDTADVYIDDAVLKLVVAP